MDIFRKIVYVEYTKLCIFFEKIMYIYWKIVNLEYF